MSLLVIGATGTLGRAVAAEARRRGLAVTAAARRGVELAVDLMSPGAVERLIAEQRPSAVVNCAAITDLGLCARDPAAAYLANAASVAAAAEAARRIGCLFVHISTDQFFTGDGARPHDEAAPTRLVNDYARSKFAGEALALAADALVVRTNLTGWRGRPERPTFIEWAVAAIEFGGPVVGFADYYTSTIDAESLAGALLDLVPAGHRGLLNLAAGEVASKLDFMRVLAEALGRDPRRIEPGSVAALAPRRAESCGLAVGLAESRLGRRLPGLVEVVRRLVRQRPGLLA